METKCIKCGSVVFKDCGDFDQDWLCDRCAKERGVPTAGEILGRPLESTPF